MQQRDASTPSSAATCPASTASCGLAQALKRDAQVGSGQIRRQPLRALLIGRVRGLRSRTCETVMPRQIAPD